MINEILKKDCKEVISNVGSKNLRAFNGKTILVTGSNGFIGQSLVVFFMYLNENFSKNIRLILLDQKRCIYPEIKNLIKKHKVKFISHNLLKKINLKDEVDYIFHLASIISPRLNSENPVDSFLINVIGTENILQSFKNKKVKKILYFSSAGIYGNPDKKNLPTSENFNGNVSSTSFRSCYAESKRAGEALVMAYSRQYNLPINIVRPSHIFGPLMDLNGDNAINYFLKSVLNNENIFLKSQGKETRSLCYISDAITIFIKIMLQAKVGEIFNAGNEKNEIKIIDLSHLIIKIFNSEKKVIFIKNKNTSFYKESMHRNNLSMKKVKNILNFVPKINIEEGIKRIIKYHER